MDDRVRESAQKQSAKIRIDASPDLGLLNQKLSSRFDFREKLLTQSGNTQIVIECRFTKLTFSLGMELEIH
jgi:hypothetical protein